MKASFRVVKSKVLSELLTFAFCSDYCAPHVVVAPYLADAEIRADIVRLVDARNAIIHGYSGATPNQITIVFGIPFRLAGALGLAVDWDNPTFKFARSSTEADQIMGQCERN